LPKKVPHLGFSFWLEIKRPRTLFVHQGTFRGKVPRNFPFTG
jgi:hypothetical protein